MSLCGLVVRRATPEEADDISRLIITTLFRSNAADYPQAVLERIAEVNAPQRILANMESRAVLVAVSPAAGIVGTASIEGNWLKALFVHPEMQGKGIGKRLLDVAMSDVVRDGFEIMQLQSSLTALAFYRAAGFEDIREIVDGEDRTVLMHKSLRAGQRSAATASDVARSP